LDALSRADAGRQALGLFPTYVRDSAAAPTSAAAGRGRDSPSRGLGQVSRKRARRGVARAGRRHYAVPAERNAASARAGAGHRSPALWRVQGRAPRGARRPAGSDPHPRCRRGRPAQGAANEARVRAVALRSRGPEKFLPTILITGAGRGLGLELARQYAQEGWRVIGTVRDG